MKKTITILFIILSASIFVGAQEKPTCPNINIIEPTSAVYSGSVMRFAISLEEDKVKLDLQYKWETDKGNIIAGQGKRKITVATDGLDNEVISASVEIVNLPNGCKSNFVETGIVLARLGCGSAVDDFGKIKKNDVRARIDAFISDIQNNPNSTGFIIQYGQPNLVSEREKLIRNHFKFRKFDLGKITFLYKGVEKEIRTKLLRIPEGVDTSILYEQR